MSQQSEIAFAHRRQRELLAARVIAQVGSQWSMATVNDLDRSWNILAPKMVATVTAGQVEAARQAGPYLSAVDGAYGVRTPDVSLVPEAFGGVMVDGREVGPAMFTAVTTAKTAIGAGVAPPAAFIAGAQALAVIVSTAVHDMGRQADITLGRAKTYTRYVRVVGGSACSRCAILAGIWSSETAFQRHASCQCTTMPVTVTRDGKELAKVPDGFHLTADSYFESLSKADQDRVFTKAGAEAIRNGASPMKVVNARRGAPGIGYGHAIGFQKSQIRGNRLIKTTIGRKADGSPLQVYLTKEGTTARGQFGRAELARASDGFTRSSTIRLMPESIIKMAGSDTTRLRELLTRYGYMN